MNVDLESSGGIWRTIGEIGVWAWMLSLLGYFYYSRGYLTLLKQIWEHVIG